MCLDIITLFFILVFDLIIENQHWNVWFIFHNQITGVDYSFCIKYFEIFDSTKQGQQQNSKKKNKIQKHRRVQFFRRVGWKRPKANCEASELKFGKSVIEGSEMKWHIRKMVTLC